MATEAPTSSQAKASFHTQLTVMCTTLGERRLTSNRCQKECVENKFDRQTDSHSEHSVHLRAVQNFDTKFFLNICC